jgi:hypothetical protein
MMLSHKYLHASKKGIGLIICFPVDMKVMQVFMYWSGQVRAEQHHGLHFSNNTSFIKITVAVCSDHVLINFKIQILFI